MIGEFNLDGIYLSPVLVSAVLAFVLSIVVRRILGRIGAYRIVWHPALFDVALFVILWALVTAAPLPKMT